jgi:hypothetical protein
VALDGLLDSVGTACFAVREARRLGTGLVIVQSTAVPLPTGAGEAAAASLLATSLIAPDALSPCEGTHHRPMPFRRRQ